MCALLICLAVVLGSAPPAAEPDAADATAVPLVTFPVPLGTVFTRHEVPADGAERSNAAGDGKLIYSNTLGNIAVNSAMNFVVDDIATVAAPGCRVGRYEFPVTGKVNPAGIGGPYSVEFGLYSSCPGSCPTCNLLIPGTNGTVSFPDDLPRMVIFALPEPGIAIATNVWFGVRFNRTNAGILLGAPATTGMSCDFFDFPGFPCGGALGGFPDHPHASFNLKLFGASECTDAFVGYKNSKPSGPPYNPGANKFIIDDITLGVPDCQMIGYEVTIKGIGFYEFEMRRDCEASAIAGTQRTAAITGVNYPIQARYTVDPPIPLPESVWFAAKVSNTTGSLVISGKQACVAQTGDSLLLETPTGCAPLYLNDPTLHDAMNLTIICAGQPPVGACCDMYFPDANGDAVCRELPEMNCAFPPRFSTLDPEWVDGATCDSDPFIHPCGVAACCRPDDVCENLREKECSAVEPIDAPRQWQRGRYCGFEAQRCPFAACLSRIGDCSTTHPEPGCAIISCCDGVCQIDDWCCAVEWDRMCVERAADLCTYPPLNDECAASYDRGAILVEADSSTFFSNISASQNSHDGFFCCATDRPWTQGLGTVWFKFVATDTSARVSTCDSDPGGDSMINIFAAEGPVVDPTVCPGLSMIGCSDSAEGCGNGRHGDICARNLVVGETYYVTIASKTPETQGLHELEIRSPCFGPPIWISDDCDEDAIPDGCLIGRGLGTDCNENLTLDECEIASGTSRDCNQDLIPDECTSALQTLYPDTRSYSFGSALAMEGELAVVGEPLGNVGTPPAGVAHVFRRSGSRWIAEASLTSSRTNEVSFGASVAIANGRVFVQAADYDGFDTGVDGAVHVFEHDADGWRALPVLEVNDTETTNRVVCKVAADGEYLAASACWTGWSFEQPLDAIVYVFRREGLDWVQEAKLTRPNPSGFSSLFGHAISLDSDRIAIGDGWESYGDAYAGGAVYVYRRTGSEWTLEKRLTPSGELPFTYFGASVELWDDLLVVGGYVGQAFIFRGTDGGWLQESRLEVPTPYTTSVAFIDDGLVILGVDGGTDGTTIAYLYQRMGSGIWGPLGTLRGSGLPGAPFVTTVRGGNDTALAGVWIPGESGSPVASVRVFAVPGGDCNANGITDACDLNEGTSTDCNDNALPDECDIGARTSRDCQPNGIPDECDVATGTSDDCNDDLIPDDCSALRQTLRSDSPTHKFGQSISVEGDLMLVGDSEVHESSAGAAYVFRRMGAHWRQEARLTGPAGAYRFGLSVAVSNGQVYVVSPGSNNPLGGVEGAVFVFAHNGIEWQHESTLLVNDAQESGRSLCLISSHGNHVAVAACWSGEYFPLPRNQPSIVYIFRRDGATWIQESKLAAPGPWATDSSFGHAISLHHIRIAIGAFGGFESGTQEGAGAAFVYRRVGTQWALEAELHAPEPDEYGRFGSSLHLLDDYLVVGGSGVTQGRQAVIFQRSDHTWVTEGAVTEPLGAYTVSFISESSFVMGATGGADGLSVGYVFQRLIAGDWARTVILRAVEPVANTNFLGSLVHGAGDSAVVATLNSIPSSGSAAVVNVFAVPASDCNQNGTADSCDLREGVSVDFDRNGLPDECDTLAPADADFDADVDLHDVAAMQRCWTGAGGVMGDRCCVRFELQGSDGDVDAFDYAAMRPLITGP